MESSFQIKARRIAAEMANVNLGPKASNLALDGAPWTELCKTVGQGTVAVPIGEKVVTPHADQDFCGCGGSTPLLDTRLTPLDKWFCKCSQNPYSG
jgi:hypothetical protein